MTAYEKYTDQELIDILKKHYLLTFIAKIELRKELLIRNIVNENRDFVDLKNFIDKEIEEIKTLKFLNDIGFEINRFNNDKSFEIIRSTKATIIDLIAIFLGLIFSIIGMLGLSLLLSYLFSDIDFTFTEFIFNLILLVIGFFGFKFFYNGLDRLIKYSGFKFVVNLDDVILRKRFNFKIKQVENKTTSLNIKTYDDEMFLMSDDIEIINATSPSYKVKMSLREIINSVN